MKELCRRQPSTYHDHWNIAIRHKDRIWMVVQAMYAIHVTGFTTGTINLENCCIDNADFTERPPSVTLEFTESQECWDIMNQFLDDPITNLYMALAQL